MTRFAQAMYELQLDQMRHVLAFTLDGFLFLLTCTQYTVDAPPYRFIRSSNDSTTPALLLATNPAATSLILAPLNVTINFTELLMGVTAT